MQFQDILPRDDYPYRVWCHVDLPEINATMKMAYHCKFKETAFKIQSGQWGEITDEEKRGIAVHKAVLDREGETAFESILFDKDNIFLCLENNGSFFETTLDLLEIDDVDKKHGIIIKFDSPEECQLFGERLNEKLASAQWEMF